jgi:hypothetical protein
VKIPQKTSPFAFRVVGRSSAKSWNNIFAFLAKEAGEVRGRADSKAAGLKRQIELFARGKIPPDELDPLCADLATSPEAMETLARLLRKDDKELPE